VVFNRNEPLRKSAIGGVNPPCAAPNFETLHPASFSGSGILRPTVAGTSLAQNIPLTIAVLVNRNLAVVAGLGAVLERVNSKIDDVIGNIVTIVVTKRRAEFFVDSSKARLSVKSYDPGLSMPYTASQSNEQRKCGFHAGSS
jgi:hypothetical protein